MSFEGNSAFEGNSGFEGGSAFISPSNPYAPYVIPIPQSLIIEDFVADLGKTVISGEVTEWQGQIRGDVFLMDANGPTVGAGTGNGNESIIGNGIDESMSIASFSIGVQDFNAFAVVERISTSVSAQPVYDFDGAARATFRSNAVNRPDCFVIGNVGQDNDSHTVTTIMDSMRVYEFLYDISLPAGFEALGRFNSSETPFNTHGPNADNTNPSFGAGELTLFRRATAPGGGLFANHRVQRLIFTQNLSALQRSAVANSLANFYALP